MPHRQRLSETELNRSGGHVRVLRVVSIGGGTGLSALLRGLKIFALLPGEAPYESDAPALISDLTAVVTVTDDGGSSGRLRRELNVLPPGDIRNCMVALAESEAVLSRLFQYRFPTGSGLEGHNFGNLFLTALTSVMGDFAAAVRVSSEILASRGHIIPSTTEDVQLEALMDDGSRVLGETNITASKHRIVDLYMIPDHPAPLPQTLEAIAQADLITLGPGSLFTSIVPNVIVKGIAQAIAESRATKAYVCNLMTQANESIGLTAADHIKAIYKHAGRPLFDYALVNTAPLRSELRAKYALEGASQIICDAEAIEALGVRCIAEDFLDQAETARHASERVAARLLQLAAMNALSANPR